MLRFLVQRELESSLQNLAPATRPRAETSIVPAPALHLSCPRCRSVFQRRYTRCPLDGASLTDGPVDPLIGACVDGRYQIEALVAEGGMGRIYRARHLRLSRPFALKVLYGDAIADPVMRSRFTREAEAISRLGHPGIVAVTDFGETGAGLLYLVMEYVEGTSLDEVIARDGPVGSARFVSIMRQLASAIAHAHERGVLHRDLKARNIILSRECDREIARVIDFGLAIDADMTREQWLTEPGLVVGTPAYMSPEHVCGRALDERSDLYSLGVVAYELLAGRVPFDGTPAEVARANVTRAAPPIRERVPGLQVDARLEAIARRLMARRPEDRFPSARGLLAHLESEFPAAPSDELPAAPEDAVDWSALADLSLDGSTEDMPAPDLLRERGGIPWRRYRRALPMLQAAFAIAILAGSIANRPDGRGAGDDVRRAEETAREPAEDAPASPAIPPAPAPGAATATTAGTIAAAATPAPGAAAAMTAVPIAAAATPAVAPQPPASSRPRPVQISATAAGGAAQVPAVQDPIDRAREEFAGRYRRVSADLNRIALERGEAAVDSLRTRLFAVPLAGALTSEAIRRGAEPALRALERDVAAEVEQLPESAPSTPPGSPAAPQE